MPVRHELQVQLEDKSSKALTQTCVFRRRVSKPRGRTARTTALSCTAQCLNFTDMSARQHA
eukprot:1792050-Prymnesium_polylepis.1